MSSSELRHCREQRPLCAHRAAEEAIDEEDSGSSTEARKQNQLSHQKHCPLYQKRPAHGSGTPTAEQGTDGRELALLLAVIFPRWLTLLSANFFFAPVFHGDFEKQKEHPGILGKTLHQLFPVMARGGGCQPRLKRLTKSSQPPAGRSAIVFSDRCGHHTHIPAAAKRCASFTEHPFGC